MTAAPRIAPKFLDPATPPHIGTLVLMAGVAASAMNVFLPAIPAIAAWYGAPNSTVQLSVSLYMALSGVLQLVIGPLADRYGRRPVLICAASGFVLASLAATFAPTVELFLIFRMLQAVIATAMVLSRAIIRDMVPENKAASMIGYVTMAMSLVPMLSPAAGGWLAETFGWQATFHFLTVMGLIVLLLVWADLGETSKTRQATMRAQLRAYPALLKAPRFWGFAVTAAAGSGAFFCYLGGAPIVGVEIFHMSAFELGLCISAPGIGYLTGNFLSGRYAMRAGVMKMVITGTLISLLGPVLMLVVTLAGFVNPYVFFGLMPLVGLGNGIALPSANSGMMSVRPDLIGSASGLGGALTIGGGAALSAISAFVLHDATTPLPLLLVMVASGMVGIIAILALLAHQRRSGKA